MISRKVSEGLPADFELSLEFARAFDLMERTDQCILVTGKAGTGKSTLLQYFLENTAKQKVVLAPTGVAAINVNGQTIHSFFGFPPKFIHKNSIRRRRSRTLIRRIDTVIIDEVSMVRADLMDGIDHALRINRGRMDVPFGGVQMIFFGDLFQLAPIVGREEAAVYAEHYPTPYFFSANVFKEVMPSRIELTRIFRQADGRFIGLLNNIRNNEYDERDFALLNSRVDRNVGDRFDQCVTLTATNRDAGAINQRRLARLAGRHFEYTADVRDDFDESLYPTDPVLKLKVGAQVMMLKNDQQKRWVNGSIGVIKALIGSTVCVEIDGKVHETGPAEWQKIVYEYNKAEDRIDEKIVGTFTQYPLKLAWAITIHKSQGQTFDNVVIDLGAGAFTHGQVYVALSRCKALEGITLKRPITARDIVFDERIHECAGVIPAG
ncbi:MAG TPA: DEAD/DEAH box helicase [Candidatus Omnitrophota bacterium]|nr:DEAD/DEAH box helicase [Candidatus Omnitrophota bacterium]HQQ05497.1 DEAD/DEAH box helicase [Candidatus Omnitrophota bacterium]